MRKATKPKALTLIDYDGMLHAIPEEWFKGAKLKKFWAWMSGQTNCAVPGYERTAYFCDVERFWRTGGKQKSWEWD